MTDFLPIICDVVAVCLLLLFAFRGRSRGLIKTLSRIIVLILAFSLAASFAKTTTPYISEKYVEPRINSVFVSKNVSDENPAPSEEEINGVLSELNLPDGLVFDAISDFANSVEDKAEEAFSTISESIAYKATYAVSFLIYFIVLVLLLNLLFGVINKLSKIPGINFINKSLGFIFGFFLGAAIIVVLSFILAKFNFVINEEIIEQTHLLKFILNTVHIF